MILLVEDDPDDVLLILETLKGFQATCMSRRPRYDNHANAFVRKPVGYTALLDVARSIQDFWVDAVLLPPHELAV